MATAGVFNGTNLLLKVQGTVVGHTTSCTLTINQDIADATTKDSAGWSEGIAGLKSGEVSFDGLVDYSDANNAEQLLDLLISRTEIDVVVGTAATGDSVYSAKGFIASLEQTGEMESAVSFSGSITLTGAVTKTLNE